MRFKQFVVMVFMDIATTGWNASLHKKYNGKMKSVMATLNEWEKSLWFSSFSFRLYPHHFTHSHVHLFYPLYSILPIQVWYSHKNSIEERERENPRIDETLKVSPQVRTSSHVCSSSSLTFMVPLSVCIELAPYERSTISDTCPYYKCVLPVYAVTASANDYEISQ